MSDFATSVKQDWDHFFTIVTREDGWITPLLSSVDGVTYDEAFWKVGTGVASIAAITMHATGWLESTLNGVLGLPEIDNTDWPEAPAASDQALSDIKERLHRAVMDLSRALHNLKLEELYGAPEGAESKRSTMLTDILVHSAYHAGQIVKLRQAYAAIAQPVAS